MQKLEEEFIQVFINCFGRNYGIPELPSRILGILYLEPEAVSMECLSEKTEYSTASVFNTLKLLEASGVVERMKKPGTKKVFFYMEKNLAKLNVMKLNKVFENMINPTKESLPQIIEKYKDKAIDEESLEKLKMIKYYHRQIIRFEEVLKILQTQLAEVAKEEDFAFT